MEEFINKNDKILKIENPITLFANILSLGSSQNFKNRSDKWHSLNTLMIINNHRRIEQLENKLELEQARVRFLEDFSGQLNLKVNGLEKSMEKVKNEIKDQKKSLTTILSLVKLITKHQTMKSNSNLEKMKRCVGSIFQNAIIFGLVQLLMRITWLDSLIDNLLGLLRLGNILSKKTMEKSRFLAKLMISITLFVILKEKIKCLLEKLRSTITFLA